MSASRVELSQSLQRLSERRGVPTWGIGSDMTIRFLNLRAAELLHMPSAEAVGRPCFEVIKAIDGALEPFCCEGCPIFRAAQDGTDLEPETLQVGSNGSLHWAQILPIVVAAPDGAEPILVESAVDVSRWARIEGYIKKVAARDPAGQPQELTRREATIMSLLAEGLAQAEIATRLHVQYTTVRSHVQNILSKLGVHSVDAAIAHRLLADSDDH